MVFVGDPPGRDTRPRRARHEHVGFWDIGKGIAAIMKSYCSSKCLYLDTKKMLCKKWERNLTEQRFGLTEKENFTFIQKCDECCKQGCAGRPTKWNSRDYQKQNYDYCKAHGICVMCKKRVSMLGSIFCSACAEKRSDRYYTMVSTAEGRKKYREEQNGYYKIRAAKRRAEGVCVVCGKRPVKAGRQSCELCLLKKSMRRASKCSEIPRHERPAYGMCYICGDALFEDHKVCERHYVQYLKINEGNLM